MSWDLHLEWLALESLSVAPSTEAVLDSKWIPPDSLANLWLERTSLVEKVNLLTEGKAARGTHEGSCTRRFRRYCSGHTSSSQR